MRRLQSRHNLIPSSLCLSPLSPLSSLSLSLRSFSSTPRHYPRPLRTKKYGIDILHDPLWNKSLAFDLSERDRLGLRGLLPPATRTLESQVARVMTRLRSLPTDIEKNLYLQDLHNRNETLYHRLLVDHVSVFSVPLIIIHEQICWCHRSTKLLH
jgi:hypothetical protein